MRNSMDAQEVAVGWWPGDRRYRRAAFYAYAHPAPGGVRDATLSPPAAAGTRRSRRVRPRLGRRPRSPDPHGAALDFARSAFATPARCAAGTPRSPPAPRDPAAGRLAGAFLVCGELGRGHGLEALVGNRLTALDGEPERSIRKARLGALQGGELLSEIVCATSSLNSSW